MKQLKKLRLKEANLLDDSQLKHILGGSGAGGGYTVVDCNLNASKTDCINTTDECEVSRHTIGGYAVIKFGKCTFSSEDTGDRYVAYCKCIGS